MVIRTYLVGIYVKIKDIGYSGKLLKLGFIIQQAKDRKSLEGEYMLDKLGKSKTITLIQRSLDVI